MRLAGGLRPLETAHRALVCVASTIVLSASLIAVPNVFSQGSRIAPEKVPAGSPTSKSSWIEAMQNLKFREIGPATQGGRIAALGVVESDPNVFYVGAATGGVWKTINGGNTFAPVFDDQPVINIGDIAVAPSDPSIVWVGTGGPVSSWGNGVYKSIDAGKTWTHMGLDDTQSIPRIVIDPTNPNIVYVAALGHAAGANEQRGLFKTSDGGQTWTKSLYLNDHVGVADVAMNLQDPKVLYAATYDHPLRPSTPGSGFNAGGPESAIYKSSDQGATWTKLTKGLPYENGGDTSHISVAVYRKNPTIVYARVERRNGGGIFRSDDQGESWTRMGPPNASFGQVVIDPNDDQRIWVESTRLFYSADGGRNFDQDLGGGTWGGLVQNVHFDFRSLWIDPRNSDHMITGNDGGLWISHDRGTNWDFVSTLPIGQIYEAGYDMAKPYHICGGMQDNGTWCGPNLNRSRWGVTNDDWYRLLLGDGVYTKVDLKDANIVYTEAQSGSLYRRKLKEHEWASLQPQPPDGEEPYRWPFDAPFVVSSHDPSILYLGANFVFKSTNRGDSWVKLGADLTTGKNAPPTEGRARNILTAISESPVDANVLWAGSGDGNVQVTRDGGKNWTNVAGRITGVPKGTWVSRIESSHRGAGTAYVTFDGSRSDDFHVYVFRTRDYGQSWEAISEGIPDNRGVAHVVREDPYNANLLFAGTEYGAYISFDQGQSWQPLHLGLPNVPVDDIQIQPREHDLILATYGRSFWVFDNIRPLEELSSNVLDSNLHVFDLRPATEWRIVDQTNGFFGHRVFITPNPEAALIDYYLKETPGDGGKVKIAIYDSAGKVVREFAATGHAGVNRVTWNLRYPNIVEPSDLQLWSTYEGFFYNAVFGPRVEPGIYTVKVTADGISAAKPIKVLEDPDIEISPSDRSAHNKLMMATFELYKKAIEEQKSFETLETSWKTTTESWTKAGAPPVPEALKTVAAAVASEVQELHSSLANPYIKSFDGGRIPPVVPVQLTLLLYTLESSTAAPTALQQRRYEELKGSLSRVTAQFEKFRDHDLPDLNKMVRQTMGSTSSEGTF